MDQIIRIPLPDPTVMRDKSRPTGGTGALPLRPFLVGPENGLVEVMVHAVLGRTAGEYNPLVLVGESGLGKSHLVRGLAAACQVQSPRDTVICQAAVDFARKLTDAIESQATDGFRRRYRSARLLILDDVTRLADHKTAQGELVHTLDAAVAAAHQVIVTAPSPPGRWVRIITALQSRLEAGLCVRLVLPGFDARLAILTEAAQRRGLSVSGPVARILAGGVQGNARDLVGALVSLHTQQRIDGRPLDIDAANAYVTALRGRPTVELREIALATSRAFSLSLGQLRSRSQRREAVSARGVAIYLARQLTDMSLGQIGHYFGGRDHTTILHSCRKMEALLPTEPATRAMVEQVREMLHTRTMQEKDQPATSILQQALS